MMAPINSSNDTYALEQVLENLLTEKEALQPEVDEAHRILGKETALNVKIQSVKNAILAFDPDFEFDSDDDGE